MDTIVLAPFSATGLAALEEFGRVTYEPWTDSRALHDPAELGERIAAEGSAVLVVEADFLFDELFELAGSLRFAAVCRAALNHVDLDAATAAGVVVVHTPGRNAQAVAELVLGQMVALARMIAVSHDYVVGKRWEDPSEPYVRFRGRELAGATLGVVGLGDIGRRVASLGRAVGMRVLAHDPYVREGARGSAGVTLTALDDLLEGSDFVSLHAPETDETTGMLDARRIGLMRRGAYLINAASPALADSAAVAAALCSGQLAGAAFDVHEAHPIPPDSPLLQLAGAGYNVLLTPHIGGATAETVERHSAMVVSDLRLFAANRRPKRLANPEVWGRRRGRG